MKKHLLNYLLPLALLLSACSTDDEEQEEYYSSRAGIVHGFLADQLQPGLSKERVVALLGKPHSIRIEPPAQRPPALDSISNRENSPYSHSDTLLVYIVKTGGVDPTLLVIKFDRGGIAQEFTLKQG